MRCSTDMHRKDAKTHLSAPRTIPAGGMRHGGTFIQSRASVPAARPLRPYVALRRRGFVSSSGLRSLSELENTDRCMTYRTDPVQVRSCPERVDHAAISSRNTQVVGTKCFSLSLALHLPLRYLRRSSGKRAHRSVCTRTARERQGETATRTAIQMAARVSVPGREQGGARTKASYDSSQSGLFGRGARNMTSRECTFEYLLLSF